MSNTQQLKTFFDDKLPTYLDILHQMVDINSFTLNVNGVNQLGTLTAEYFAKLGFQAEFVSSNNPNNGDHLVLTRFSQDSDDKKTNPTLALISHLDTVFSPEEEAANNFSWRPEGDRIYGPGTVDIKGGTVMVYMVLDAIKTHYRETFDRVNWMILINASEETLCEDFGQLCLKRIPPDALACLVFEGGKFSNHEYPLVVGRKGRATFRVQVEGRSAHAGNNHAQGANAIEQLAHTILEIASFTDYDKDITFNVGTVKGGSVVNRVPHIAEARVEMRAFSTGVFDEGLAKMLALDGTSQVASSDGYPCKMTVQLSDQAAPWSRDSKTLHLFNLWNEVATGLGIRITPEKRGGLSDGNWLWQHFPTFDGLGPVGSNAHCSERSVDGSKDQEYVSIPSFVPKASLNTLAILKLLQN
jgi:glutamate carboxypeptidase